MAVRVKPADGLSDFQRQILAIAANMRGAADGFVPAAHYCYLIHRRTDPMEVNQLRVSLNRLVSKGLLESKQEGHTFLYRLKRA